MKLKGIAIILLIVTALINVSCGNNNTGSTVSAGAPESYSLVSKDRINGVDIVTVRHNATGCHYSYTHRTVVGTSSSESLGQLTPVANKEGPYCP